VPAPRKGRREMPPTRRGYQPHEVVSALQKTIRRSDPKGAAYWAMELFDSGYRDWCWKRLMTILSEDIGPADRYLPATIVALRDQSLAEAKKGGGGMELVHATILMATAEKSRLACWQVLAIVSNEHERLEIPDEALDRHTRAGLRKGRGWDHFLTEAQKLIDPDQAARDRGFENSRDELAALSQEYEEHFERKVNNDPSLPTNPWRPKPPRQVNPEGVSTHDLEGPNSLPGMDEGDS
jgi:replication-associated recombination protein RarA